MSARQNTRNNIGARYEIIGRVPDGTNIIGYVLRDTISKKNIVMSKGAVEQLALKHQIYNCSAQIYKDIVNLKGINCKISNLPKYDIDGNRVEDNDNKDKKEQIRADLKIIGKVQSGRIITDYVIISVEEPSKYMKLPRDIVIDLAKDGRLVNARSQMNDGEMILRGSDGYNLMNLKNFI